MALPHQFVNRDGRRAELFDQQFERGILAICGVAGRLGAAAIKGSRGCICRAIARGGGVSRCNNGPSWVRISAAVSVRVAPLRSKSLQPRLRGSSGEPGTANTSRPCSSAKRAVISEPDFAAASTTTTPRAMPEMIRLRRGK